MAQLCEASAPRQGTEQDKMTVLVNFIALHGDGCRYALEMSRGLAQSGVNVLAVVSKNMENIQDWRNCEDIDCYEVNGYTSITNMLPRLMRFIFKDMPRIRKLKKETAAKYVYVPIQTFWTAFMEMFLGKHRLIYTMHDPIPHNAFRLININNRYCAKKARILVLLSKNFNDYAQKKFRPHRIVNLQLGNSAYYTDKADQKMRVAEYDPNKINLVFHGIINPYKGLHVLAQAYEKVSKVREDVTLSIIGSGDFSPYAADFAKLPRVTVVNRWLQDEEIASVYEGDNVIAVLPYVTATQSGVVTLAMQCGAPVIASDCGGISEQIVDGQTGFLVPAADAEALCNKILDVIDHPQQREEVSRQAKQYIESISSTSQAKLLLEAISADRKEA